MTTQIAQQMGAVKSRKAIFLVAMSCVYFLSFIFISAAQAKDNPSLKELRARQAEERALASEMAYTNQICETRIQSRIDWQRMSKFDPNKSLARFCDGALSAIEATCRGGKKLNVQQKIDTFVCAGDGTGATLNGGVLTYGVGPRGSAYRDVQQLLNDL